MSNCREMASGCMRVPSGFGNPAENQALVDVLQLEGSQALERGRSA
jgi:hypothetical protein